MYIYIYICMCTEIDSQVCGPGVDFRLVGERIEDVAVRGPNQDVVMG